MVKRKLYSLEYKNKLGAEMVGGISIAEISQREGVSSATLKRWKEEYLNFSGEETISKKEVIDLRKKVGELSVLLADALLEIDILKKTEKFLVAKKRKELLSSAISPSSLGLRKASKR
jgi:transposase-like protein